MAESGLVEGDLEVWPLVVLRQQQQQEQIVRLRNHVQELTERNSFLQCFVAHLREQQEDAIRVNAALIKRALAAGFAEILENPARHPLPPTDARAAAEPGKYFLPTFINAS